MSKKLGYNDTRYFEKYARDTLEAVYGSDWENFKVGESPDLQSEELEVGVEVTRAISKNEGYMTNKINQLISGGFFDVYNENTIVEEIENKNLKGEFLLKNGHLVFREDDDEEFKIHIENIETSVITKTEKLNKNYKIFNENDLYIFTFDDTLTSEDIERKIYQIKTKTNDLEIKFDKLFINCLEYLFIVDMHREEVQTINLIKE